MIVFWLLMQTTDPFETIWLIKWESAEMLKAKLFDLILNFQFLADGCGDRTSPGWNTDKWWTKDQLLSNLGAMVVVWQWVITFCGSLFVSLSNLS